ncbi:MAG: hypothetical protein HGA27_06290 [Peptococcaceae bacterium]|nr:hypothetical protein [Peptococcaceae bacterium]
MKVAFHFDADHERFDRYDGIPVIKEIFDRLTQEPGELYLKIFTGNIDVLDYLREKDNREEIQKGIYRAPRPVWQSLNPKFMDYLYNNKIFVVAFEGINSRFRDILHNTLLNDDTYLGAQQLHEANPVHWILYGASVVPMFRINGKKLSLLYSIGQEFEWDRALVANLKSDFSFETIEFEEISVSHTILDNYSSFEHASRVVNLSNMLYDHLNLLADQLMLRLTNLAPELYGLMYDTIIEFESLDKPGGLQKAAVAGKNLLAKLAAHITNQRDDNPEDYGGKILRHISGLAGENRQNYLRSQFQEIDSCILRFSSENIDNDLDAIYQGDRLLVCLIVFVNDLLESAV